MHQLFFNQWPQKLISLVAAIIIWFVVSHSIISTVTIPFIPIRVINLPENKTIQGLQPNGVLSKRATLTLTGTKDIIDKLEPGDVEVVVDVSNLPSDGIMQITKKNLVSLNPNINLPKHITQITPPEFVIKMSLLLTEKIPVTIHTIGEAPKGYKFIDIWPPTLIHTVTGPEDLVHSLKNSGLDLTIDLNSITKEELDAVKSSQVASKYDDEVNFYVPGNQKRVLIPFHNNMLEIINDPEAKNLQIDFLKQEWLPFKGDIPVRVFYPLKYSDTLNPASYPLATSNYIKLKNEIRVLSLPLFAWNVSQLFLDVVRDNIELSIIAAPESERDRLEWSIDFLDYAFLEDNYVALLLSESHIPLRGHEREAFLRQRYRRYMREFSLYLSPQHKLELDSQLKDKKVNVQIPYAR